MLHAPGRRASRSAYVLRRTERYAFEWHDPRCGGRNYFTSSNSKAQHSTAQHANTSAPDALPNIHYSQNGPHMARAGTAVRSARRWPSQCHTALRSAMLARPTWLSLKDSSTLNDSTALQVAVTTMTRMGPPASVKRYALHAAGRRTPGTCSATVLAASCSASGWRPRMGML